MSGGEFPLDVDPDEVDLAATRLQAMAGDLESERAGVAAAPGSWSTGWTGGAATAVSTETTALAGHMATFGGHLQAATTALGDLAAAYRTAQDETLPALRERWAQAESDYSASVTASLDQRGRDVDAIPPDAGAQRRTYQTEADSAHAARTSAAAGERTTTQASTTAAYDQLLADLRTRTAATGQTLASAVVVPVPDQTVSTYLATGTTDLGPLPPTQLADLSLAQQHQVAEDLEAASLLVEQDVAAGELDEEHLDDLDALLGFTGGHVLLADAARGARERVAGGMADLGRSATALEADGDEEAAAADVQLLGALLDRYAEDEDMTSPFLTDLGGGGTLDLTLAVDQLSAGDPATNPLLATAAALRTAVQTSSRDSSFSGSGFARDLVRRTVERTDEDGLRSAPGTSLSYLLDGDDYGTWFLTSAVEEMVSAEQAHAGEHGGDGSDLWATGIGRPSHLATTFDGSGQMHVDGRLTEYQNSWDPMLSAVRQLADEPLAGRDVLAGTTGEYLFGERGWAHDGFSAVVAAGEAAATDAVPGTVGWDGASMVASTMVNGLGARDDVAGGGPFPGLSGTSSTQLAHVLATHLPAVQESVLRGSDDLSGGVVDREHVNAALGPQELTIALFDRSALEGVTGLAAQDGDGVALLRAGLNDYQGLLASSTADQVMGFSPEQRQTFLSDQMGGAGALEAFFGDEIGEQAERLGRERDDVVRFWVDAASFGVDQGNGALGSVPNPAAKLASLGIGQVSGPAFDAMKDAWADAEEDAATQAESAAQTSSDRVSYGYMQSLQNAGVLDVQGLPDGALTEDGRLVDWQDLDPDDVHLVLNRFESDYDGPVTASSGDVAEAMRELRLPFYDDWTKE